MRTVRVTRAEQYGKVCQWFAEGRLLVKVGSELAKWYGDAPPSWDAFQRDHNPDRFVENKHASQMPDEVWLPQYSDAALMQPSSTREECIESYASANPVRYVRADRIIDGAKLQHRVTDGTRTWWVNCRGCEYQFVP